MPIRVMHVVAVKDEHARWDGTTPVQLSMLDFWNLIFVWLKMRCIIQYPLLQLYDNAKLILSDFLPGFVWLLSRNSYFCLGNSFVHGRLSTG